MIFSPNMLLEENYNKPTKIENNTFDGSYFSMGLKFVNELSTDFNNANKVFYKSLLEANGNEEVIQESFSGFVDKVKEIINKFLEFLKRVWNKFIININKLVKSDKYLTKHKADFDKFDSTHNFDMKIYKYTFLEDENFPKMNAFDHFNKITENYKLTTDSSVAPTADIFYSRLSDTYNTIIEDTSDWLEVFRGEVLGDTSGSKYTEKEFLEELHDKFRNGESSPSKETISYSEVRTAYDRFANYDKSVKAVERLKKTVENEYKKIKDSIKNLPTEFNDTNDILKDTFNNDFSTEIIKYTSITLDDKDKKRIENKIDSLNKLRINRIESMCKIHSLAFTKKLDAMKEAYNQDKKVLYTALKKLNKKSEYESSIDLTMDSEDTTNSYTSIIEYANFVIRESENQNAILRYIGECVALDNGDFNTLEAMNESAIDVIKNIIEKIIQAIKNMFGKFTTTMSSMFTTDATFLQKYKDVILKKPFKDRDVTMYNYDVKKLDNYTIPKFNESVFNWIDNGTLTDDQTIEKFISTYSSINLNGMKPEGGEIKEKIIDAVRGEEEVETKLEALNKEEMFNFCIHYKNTLNMLNKDESIITSNQTEINRALSKKSNEFEQMNRDAKNGTSANQNASTAGDIKVTSTSATPPANQNVQNASTVYSNVYGRYITELKVGSQNKDSSASSASNSKSNSTNNSAIKSSVGDNKINVDTATTSVGYATNKYNNSVASGSDDELNKAKTSIENYRELVKNYFMCCSEILAAKMELCKKIYTDYMKILRIHVKDYGGSVDGDKSSEQKGVDASKEFTFTAKDKNGNFDIKFVYFPDYKIDKSLRRLIDDGITVKGFKAIGSREDKDKQIQQFSSAMTSAAQKILNRLPTPDDVFSFGDKWLHYKNNEWTYCNPVKKTSAKVKDTFNVKN